ncbi:MAG TPA: crossover junction endodeoxyribonuclease RuvC [Prolixibacteraceae bacterium]|nr:crossover junction endodeoxyribonuclease RuvC [Prolixibacteraceae bacterium]HPS12111.1 crossover junction endodeoxyribonuclease RuvC [Prolixibacteraceae bacterium]
MAESKIILGIDPGSNVMGYGLLKVEMKKTSIITMGVIAPGKLPSHYDKLKFIFDRVLHVIDEYHPDEVALEAPFFGKNVQSMLKLGRAQGVAMAAALYRNLPIAEYAPLLVKQSITGMGRASKEQVAYFLQKIYGITELPSALDATDAVAVAVCHYLQSTRPVKTKEYKNWDDYIRKNPDKVKK